jgi:glycerol kinase
MAEQTELLHGTLDTLILKTLSWGPRHATASRGGSRTPPTMRSASGWR